MSFRLDPSRLDDAEIRRVGLHQIAKADACVRSIGSNPLKGPHETRKRIKKIRAHLRLLRSADEDFYQIENARWRQMAASLAGPREAAALVETVDRFIAEFADDGNRHALDALRARLAQRLVVLEGDSAGLATAVANCMEGCAAATAAMENWPLPSSAKAISRLLAQGAKATWKDAKKAFKCASKRGREDDFHDLRKAVKRHWAHLGLLRDFWPGDVKRRRKAVELLGERLGELNDIFVMNELMRNGEIAADDFENCGFDSLLKRKRRQLASKSLTKAGKLFQDRPDKLKAHFLKAAERKQLKVSSRTVPAERKAA